jgi:hypothetical protein
LALSHPEFRRDAPYFRKILAQWCGSHDFRDRLHRNVVDATEIVTWQGRDTLSDRTAVLSSDMRADPVQRLMVFDTNLNYCVFLYELVILGGIHE